MTDGIEKGKKKRRRRSARIYVNANKPLAVDVAGIAGLFPPDDEGDGVPESSEKSLFNHVDPYTGSEHAANRASAPIEAGHAAVSTGDHGPGAGRSSFIAAHHPDLKQSNTSFDQVLARLRTAPPEDASRAITYTPGEVALRMFDAAGDAGHYHGMGPVDPSPERQDWHQHRSSATPPTPGHSLADPQSHAAGQAMKSSELRAEFKRMLFPGSGGSR